jgi:DNA-binding transcriptional MerR regulator
MEYTVKKLASLSGVSGRTLRFYDETGLLKPARINSSGYRIYTEKEVDLLQQILFYRELSVNLGDIKSILYSPGFNRKAALDGHLSKLLAKRARLDALIRNVRKTQKSMRGESSMTDKEKFEGFKQNLIDENEKKYGKEIREKYGEDAVSRSNKKLKGMTKEQHEKLTALNERLMQTLQEAFREGDPKGKKAQEAADLHRQWLSFYWDSYSKEAHAGVAQMYVEDERFTAYYDAYAPGLARFLRDAVLVYTGADKTE